MKSIIILTSFLASLILHASPVEIKVRKPLEWKEIQTTFKDKEAYKKGNEEIGFTWKSCEDSKKNFYPILSDDNIFINDECIPDTLYSWGPAIKLLSIRKQLSGHNWSSELKKAIFSYPNPVATHGYGTYALRFKIKEDVKFYLLPKDWSGEKYCESIEKNTNRSIYNTIVTRYVDRGSYEFLDYIICSSEVISSWSYGTKEHYDEVIYAMNWQAHYRDETNGHYKYELYKKKNGVDELTGFKLDEKLGTDWSWNALKHRSTNFRFLAEQDLGEIFYNPIWGREDHFSTRRPIYYNDK